MGAQYFCQVYNSLIFLGSSFLELSLCMVVVVASSVLLLD